MTAEDDARERVESELAWLRERFGPFEVEHTTVVNDPSYYRHGLDIAAREGMLADAGALVTDGEGRVLLIRHPDASDSWGLPGGTYESADGHLPATAEREVREETGVECETGALRFVAVKTIEHRSDDRSYPLLTAVFAGQGTGDPTAADDEEVLEARWFGVLPELHDSARRLLDCRP